MLRSQRHILENRLEVLQAQRRELDERVASAEARLHAERDRYEALAQHWQRVGLEVVLTEADLAADRRRVWRTFVRGFVAGLMVPAAVALLALLA